ncbi:hypothetical protein H012_gp771 [Acanthamoeba polyphaga moumouvirus]|uniref:Uncharacterized protein n=2 Tax=Moumouvirus TaxID=3080801 RepID=L7RB79_9VIRU|nr:hypothetical protein H012_gp771 [Acanthamoeba polyphaga moumouvirus]AEX63144.1 hypothetical protein mv_L942 [Moumouvirus Monve]AGC01694.1 hypothetical protein Moumou_00150 [Acanthamoeba polyphaga moumouvirus]AQN68032.1 hypothetical protein [Saudi moumouvirus]
MLSDSETIAQMSNGVYKHKYVPKSQRDNITNYEEDLRKFLLKNSNEDLLNDMEYETNIIDFPYCQKVYELIFSDPENKSELVSMNLEIKFKNYNEDFLDRTNEIQFEIEIGKYIILRTNLENIIMLSKYLGMDITYENDVTIIPIPLKQLFFCKNFPLYKLKYMTTIIKIYNNSDYINHLTFNYQTKNLFNPNKFSYLPKRIIFFQSQQKKYKSRMKLNFKLVCKVIMFTIEYDNEKFLNPPQVNQIKLYLNNNRPIIYHLDSEEILEYNIFGKKYYAISLCKELVHKKDIKKIFRDEENIPTGINFSRIENKKISVICDDYDISGCFINFAVISINELNFSNGMTGLKFVF